MDKHAKRSSLLHYPVLIVFTLFFVGLFALDLITPDRAYSEMENTTLSQRPALTQLSAKGLNSYFTAYTKYVKDQVFGRDQWISLQSMVETTLLQKEQNGGILLGREHMMFPRTFGLLSSEERTLPKNTSAVESLCQRYPGKVNVLLAPAASDIYPENVPVNAPLLDENTYLDQLSAAVQAAGGRFVDVRGTLTDHKGEYLYYRTDHHWTSLGAYYAYQQLCTALGLTPFDTAAHTALTADCFYGTHYSKARTWNAVPDTITWYDLPNQLTIYNVTAAGQPTDGTDHRPVRHRQALGLRQIRHVPARQQRPEPGAGRRHRKDPCHQGQLRQLFRALPHRQLRRHRRGGLPQLQLWSGPADRRQRL